MAQNGQFLEGNMILPLLRHNRANNSDNMMRFDPKSTVNVRSALHLKHDSIFTITQ